MIQATVSMWNNTEEQFLEKSLKGEIKTPDQWLVWLYVDLKTNLC